MRQRDNLIKSACVHVQRMQKALTEMNIQLHRVISDITGTTGMAKEKSSRCAALMSVAQPTISEEQCGL
jgi:hypothetical protein